MASRTLSMVSPERWSEWREWRETTLLEGALPLSDCLCSHRENKAQRRAWRKASANGLASRGLAQRLCPEDTPRQRHASVGCGTARVGVRIVCVTRLPIGIQFPLGRGRQHKDALLSWRTGEGEITDDVQEGQEGQDLLVTATDAPRMCHKW